MRLTRDVGAPIRVSVRVCGMEAAAIVVCKIALRSGDGRGTTMPMKPRASQAAGARTIPGCIEAWGRDLSGRLGFGAEECKKCIAAARSLFATAGWSELGELRPRVGDSEAIIEHNSQRVQPVLDWLDSFIDPERPGSRKTAKNQLYRVRAFGDFLTLHAGFHSNPFASIRLPRVRRVGNRGPVPFSWEEVRRLIQVAHEQERTTERAARFGPLRSTFYTFLPLTGLRYSEARRQKWEDIDLDKGVLRLTGDKSDRGDPISLPPECVAALQAWREWGWEGWGQGAAPWRRGAARHRQGYLFPVVPSPGSLVRDMERAGVQRDGKPGQWHRFRKALASELAKVEPNPNVTHKNLRHTDAGMTMNLYTHVELERQRAALAKLPALNGFFESSLDSPRDLVYGRDATSDMRAHPHHPGQNERPSPLGSHVTLQSVYSGGPEGVLSSRDRVASPRKNTSHGAGVSSKWRQGDSTSCLHDATSSIGAVIAAHDRFLRIVADAMRRERGGQHGDGIEA